MTTREESPQSYSFEKRYDLIDDANAHSFWMSEDHGFETYLSVQSIGPSRQTPEQLAARNILAGNMSSLGTYGPNELTREERILDARKNMQRFFEQHAINQDNVRILNPERDYTTPLTVVNVDADPSVPNGMEPIRLTESGDFIYSYDPETVLAVRPADCPVIIATADTPKGKIHMMIHYAWTGVAVGYVEQTAKIFEEIGVDKKSLRMYISPGGHAESFKYEGYPDDPRLQYPGNDLMFLDVEETTEANGSPGWSFKIDTTYALYQDVLNKIGIDPYQVFCDTSDTASLESGYSSNTRAFNVEGESNTRDLFVASFENND